MRLETEVMRLETEESEYKVTVVETWVSQKKTTQTVCRTVVRSLLKRKKKHFPAQPDLIPVLGATLIEGIL